MCGKIRKIIFTFVLILCVSSMVVSAIPIVEGKQEMYFTLVAKSTSGARADYLMLVKQQIARIGIDLDVIIQDWATFIGELIAFRNFDLVYMGFTGGGLDPDFTGVYNENGSLNLFGYHTDMDYDSALGTGKNEWYMRQGTLIMPPNSEERIQHYWEWEQYMMDEILPLKPMFAPKDYTAYWSNLQGYDSNVGLLQSWGKMNWTSSHAGQTSTDEVVIADAVWSDLNPLYQDDSSSSFISSATMDPLIWFDNDSSAWPHLAKSWVHLNDTYVRITLREGVKWQSDPDGNFTDEYFDVEDVYFTIYCWRRVSGDDPLFFWIEDIKIVDKYTIDIFIDGEPGTQENEPYAPYITTLKRRMLPEHYLNQTQYPSGKPDLAHPSWTIFATNCFGTGLFDLTSTNPDIETILNIFPDCWRLNSTLTNDSDLDWNRRFGDFSSVLDQLRVRQIPDFYGTLVEFEQGKVDIVVVTRDRNQRESYILHPDITVQSKIMYYLGYIGYNMRTARPEIGNPNPWSVNESLTKGLALRKAISYAIDREEINQVVHGGDYGLTDHPIYTAMGVWCNPNIIQYNFDLDKAMFYMSDIAGQSSNVIEINLYPLFVLSEVLLCVVYLRRRKKN